jgi:hypothetical protein
MLKKFSILFALIGLITITSCDKDFSLNGDYKRTPVIFALIDQSDSIHMVRITRTYLGDGDNNEYAMIPDSNYFDQVDAKIVEYNNGDSTGRVWQLHDTLITNKEDGLFYGPEQKMYTFYANDLVDEYTYKFVAIFDEGKYEANAETDLIYGVNYSGVWSTAYPYINFASVNSSTSNIYPIFKPVTQGGNNIALRSAKLEINYKVLYSDGSTALKQIVWSKANESDLNVSFNFNGEEFFQTIKNNIDTDADVEGRQMIDVTVVTTMIDEDTKNYMDVSQPSSSISQSKPQFTNVNSEDGALGLFSARHTLRKTLPLSASSIEELCIGQYTIGLGFCSTLDAHIAESWHCD